MLSTDKLRISLDLSAGGPANNSIYVHFNDDWQVYVIAPAIDSVPGYQTYTLDLGPCAASSATRSTTSTSRPGTASR